jgi:hypothetical protein
MIDGVLEEFERGQAIEVPVSRVEAELAALWRRAADGALKAGEVRGRTPGQTPSAVTRACLWNLVVRVEGEDEFIRMKRLIDDLAQRIPARTIVVRAELEGTPQIRAWVEANWRRREGGGPASGSDEITLLASGPEVAQLPSLVRALLYSDAPTAIYWPSKLPRSEMRDDEILHQAERLIVDTRRLPDERDLVALCAIAAGDRELELADLSWLGISPLRGLCAALFDPPHDPSVLEKVDRVRVTSNIEGTQARALLCLGWLFARLGFTGQRRSGGVPGLRRWQAQRRDGGNVTLELATEPGGNHGVAGLEIVVGDRVWSLERDDCIHVRAPDSPPRAQPARSHSDPELVAAALGGRGRDPIYRDALGGAVALVRA